MRGAWIEILLVRKRWYNQWSLPMRGAWIEIMNYGFPGTYARTSLPMRGAWIEIIRDSKGGMKRMVAPHAGSVD